MSKAVDIFSGILFVRTRHYDDVKKVVVLQGNKPERRFFEEQPQGEWIPVSERLPKDRNLVLVTAYWHETYQIMQASYFGEGEKNGWWCVPFNNCGEHMRNDLHVIAWQPLPEPYKKGGAE